MSSPRAAASPERTRSSSRIVGSSIGRIVRSESPRKPGATRETRDSVAAAGAGDACRDRRPSSSVVRPVLPALPERQIPAAFAIPAGRIGCSTGPSRGGERSPRPSSTRMTHAPALATLLRRILEQELEVRGLAGAAGAREAAWREVEHSLRPGAGAAIPTAALERALEQAARVAAGDPELPVPPSTGEARELAPGDVLDGKYEIEALLAEGGFGQVYRARDRALDCAVAIKVLKADAEGARERLLELQE